MVQVRSTEMFTPRNLVLLTVSTVELLMLRGIRAERFFNDHFFSLVHIQRQIVLTAPDCQQLHSLSVSWLVIGTDEPLRSCVVSKFDEVVLAMCSSAVMGQQGEQQWTQNAALRNTCAHSDGVRDVAADLNSLWPL